MRAVENHTSLREIKMCKNGFSANAVDALVQVIGG
jgi:hypothetical protein